MATPLTELFPELTVIPVVTVDENDSAVAIASALQRAGLPIMELTLRTPGAWAAAAAVRAACPDLLLGIGTVTTTAQLDQAVDIGASFAVSPGFAPALAKAALPCTIAYLPGVASPGELMQAGELGYAAVKVFPAAQLGGPGMLRQFGHLMPGMSFCPTGGISEASLADYLAVPGVFAVGGSWLAPRASIEAGNWSDIEARARRALDICRGSRPVATDAPQ